jgi:pyridoxine 4-dehydrogenase
MREALYPYPDELVIVSKVGAERDNRGQWLAAQRPEQLRAGIEANLASLGLEQIPVVNLRRHPESEVSLTEQLEAMEVLRQEGLIGRIGIEQRRVRAVPDRPFPDRNRVRSESLQLG